ncbi:Uncharacterised protein [Shigella flexneri]|nr:Uncharacterised protein [Shigella flexneri]
MAVFPVRTGNRLTDTRYLQFSLRITITQQERTQLRGNGSPYFRCIRRHTDMKIHRMRHRPEHIQIRACHRGQRPDMLSCRRFR